MLLDPIASQTMRAMPRRARRSPWLQLLAALLELAQGKAELIRHGERAWASVTFSGSRHEVVLAFTGTENLALGETFVEALPDHEFTLPRQLVADAAIVRVTHDMLPEPRMLVELELLLLDDT